MRQTLQQYRERIRSGAVNPLVRWDGRTSGLIFDPQRDEVPLTLMGFGACRLESGPHRFDTCEREFVFVPIEGQFEVRIGPERYSGRRDGGPFAMLPGKSSACTVYAPAGATVEVSGKGEMIYYTAPALGSKPPAFVRPGDRENVVRGSGLWRREVVTLFTPEDVTTVLVGGETYSPPGLWSGTPLHIHDLDDAAGGQSDHEEVYYHLTRIADGKWGSFGVQMLFDDAGLNNAYVIHNRDAFAVPGAAHPVISGPNSDMLYVWALAGSGSSLRMADVPEFAYLKKVGAIIDELAAEYPRRPAPGDRVERLIAEHELTAGQARICRMHLRQQGFDINVQ